MGCISPVDPPVLDPRLGFPRQERAGGENGADKGGGEPRPGLKPHSVALGWLRSRAVEQKPGSLLTLPRGLPPWYNVETRSRQGLLARPALGFRQQKVKFSTAVLHLQGARRNLQSECQT